MPAQFRVLVVRHRASCGSMARATTRCWPGDAVQVAFVLEATSVQGLRSSPRPGPQPIASEALARSGEFSRNEGDIRGRTDAPPTIGAAASPDISQSLVLVSVWRPSDRRRRLVVGGIWGLSGQARTAAASGIVVVMPAVRCLARVSERRRGRRRRSPSRAARDGRRPWPS